MKTWNIHTWAPQDSKTKFIMLNFVIGLVKAGTKSYDNDSQISARIKIFVK